MRKVIISIGIQGSGKSTFLKPFAEHNNYVYLSPDAIRQELLGNPYDQSKNAEVWDELRNRITKLMQEGVDIVVDSTFTNFEQRIAFISFLRKSGVAEIQGIFFDTPLEIARKRTLMRERQLRIDAIDEKAAEIKNSPPNILDGFDTFYTIDEFQKIHGA